MIGLLRERQAAVALGIAVVGLVAAGVIYLSASVGANGAPEGPDDSKQYLRQMEVYGGKANVLAAQTREWFAGLWHGRRLAFTVAVLSLVAALLAFVALTPLPPADRDKTPTSRGADRAE